MTIRGVLGARGQVGAALATAAAGAGNGLLNNLIAYWPGNEVAGNALDLHTNALHLTDAKTVTSNPGLVYPLARQYTAANNEYHTRLGDDAFLRTGDVDFTIASFVYLDDKGAGLYTAFSRWGTDPFNEYIFGYLNTVDRFRFYVSDDGTVAQTVDANTFGSPATSTWYLVICSHDAANDQISIQVNNGTIDTLPHTTGVHASTATAMIGQTQQDTLQQMNGRIGPTMFWKSAPGGGGVLTAAQRTALYNAGAGLTYAEFTT